MSESVASEGSVARQQAELAMLAGANVKCSDFIHTLINSKVDFTGSSTQDLINFTVSDGGGLVITRIDVKTLFDTTDALLTGDFRATDDFNPYGPFAAGSLGTGTIAILFDGQQQGGTAQDFGLINRPILFIASATTKVEVSATTNQPAGKKLRLVTCMTCWQCASKVAIEGLKKNNLQTQIISQ